MNHPPTTPELDHVFKLLLDDRTELEQLTEHQQTLFIEWIEKLIELWRSES